MFPSLGLGTQCSETGDPLQLMLYGVLIEPDDLLYDVAQLVPVPLPDAGLLLLTPAHDTDIMVTWETIVPAMF